MSARLGIAGITGQVGKLLIDEIASAGETLAGGTVRPASGKPIAPGIATFTDIGRLADQCDAVIDFTHAEMVVPHARALATRKAAWIIGTSGLSHADDAAMRTAAKTIPVVYAASFGPTAVLVPELVTSLATQLPASDYDVEILETHHRHKVDAPSGVALTIGRLIADARGQNFDDVRVSGRDGDIGPRKTGAIGFGAIRAGEITGETSVYFLSDDEHIVLTRRVFDRRVYAAGAVLAAQWAIGRTPGFYSMRDVLGLPNGR